MATVDLTSNASISQVGSRAFVVSATVDFSETSRSQNDVLQLFDVAAGQRVVDVTAHVETAEGATFTFDIGDGADANGYLNNVNGNSAGYTGMELALAEGTPNTVSAYSDGKLYTSADTVDMVLDNNASTAKVHVRALIVDFST